MSLEANDEDLLEKLRVADHPHHIGPAAFSGQVYAPDAQRAIVTALEEFQITNRECQKRLLAERVG